MPYFFIWCFLLSIWSGWIAMNSVAKTSSGRRVHRSTVSFTLPQSLSAKIRTRQNNEKKLNAKRSLHITMSVRPLLKHFLLNKLNRTSNQFNGYSPTLNCMLVPSTLPIQLLWALIMSRHVDKLGSFKP